MTTNETPRRHEAHQKSDEQDTKLERVLKKIVPPSHEPSDEDLKDPGNMTPNAPPTDNRT